MDLVPVAAEAATGLWAPRVGRTTRGGGRVGPVRPRRAGRLGRTAPARGVLLPPPSPARAAEHFAEVYHRWQDIGRPNEVAKAAECRGEALTCSSTEDAAAHLADAARIHRARHDRRRRTLPTPPSRPRCPDIAATGTPRLRNPAVAPRTGSRQAARPQRHQPGHRPDPVPVPQVQLGPAADHSSVRRLPGDLRHHLHLRRAADRRRRARAGPERPPRPRAVRGRRTR